MSELIERAAEELYLHDAANSPGMPRKSLWMFLSVKKQQAYRDRVSVVLQAIREPPKDTIYAGDRIIWDNTGMSIDVWQAMIDEAMK